MATTPAGTPWRLESELGAVYRSGDGDQLLRFPWYAAWTEDGTCLVSDRRNPLNVLSEFDADGRLLWTHRGPPRMNVVVPLDSGARLAFTGASARVLSPDGTAGATIPTGLDVVPNGGGPFKGGAILACDTGVFAYTPGSGPTQLIGVDEGLTVEPQDVHSGVDGLIAVTDGTCSCVFVYDRDGRHLGVVGRVRRPGRTGGSLLAPQGACVSDEGRILVAETRLHRVAEFDLDGAFVRELRPRGIPFHSPASVRPGPAGSVLVVDSGNHRVVLCAPDGRILWQVGDAPYRSRLFSFPRSVAYRDGLYTVTDSYHDRVVTLDDRGAVRWVYGRDGDQGDDAGLNVLRGACQTAGGGLAIADGLNARLVVVDAAGRMTADLTEVVSPERGRVPLGDPHDVSEVEPGLLQVVDSDLNAVLWLDHDGRIHREWYDDGQGTPFKDPHQAAHRDGWILVADSLNRRIVLVPTSPGGSARVLAADLEYPRFVCWDGDSAMVANTDGGQIMWLDEDGDTVERVGPVLPLGDGLPSVNPELRLPKAVARVSSGRIVVADMLNSRVVVLSRVPRPDAG